MARPLARPQAFHLPAASFKEPLLDARSQEEEAKKRALTEEGEARRLLSKLDVVALRKYRLVHSLGRAPPSSTKEEMLPAVVKHFNNQVVDETEVLVSFAKALQRRHN